MDLPTVNIGVRVAYFQVVLSVGNLIASVAQGYALTVAETTNSISFQITSARVFDFGGFVERSSTASL